MIGITGPSSHRSMRAGQLIRVEFNLAEPLLDAHGAAERSKSVKRPRGCRTAGSVQPHLRMHKPVVVPAAGHSAPSGVPAEQTTETSTSSALQPTVFSPLTIRKPVMPAGPGGPIGPGEP